ncbi:MAG: HD-GYP domain-containing protein [Acetivibrionales bacterium]|jgi:HD-GYP domain-containing protein (c-di-GMP phosphodiesterase class II)
MKKVTVSELKPGMKLAGDIYSSDGKLLLLSDAIIRKHHIKKLQLFDIDYVFVYDDILAPAIDLRETKVYSDAYNTVKSVLTSVIGGNELDVPAVRETVNEIVSQVMDNEEVFMQLNGIRDMDNYTFMHSVDVCIFSVIIGKNMQLQKQELLDLATASLLHDIGKCKIPPEILFKPKQLTEEEFEIVKLHTLYGYEILTKTDGINERIACTAYQHHEKWDGTGYPCSLKGLEIDLFARIVSVADIYDAITSERIYKTRNMPYEGASYIINKSGIYVDPDIAKLFIKNIAVYPKGSIVLLNTGEIGNIVGINKNMSIKPKIQVIAHKDGPPVYEPYILDLTQEQDVFIVDVLL